MIVYDLAGVQHDKQPIDAKECVDRLGWTYKPEEKSEYERRTRVADALNAHLGQNTAPVEPVASKPAKKAVKDDSDTTPG